MNKLLFLLSMVLFAGCCGRGQRNVEVTCEKPAIDLEAYLREMENVHPAWTGGTAHSGGVCYSSSTRRQTATGNPVWIERIRPTCSASESLVAEAIESVRTYQPTRYVANRPAQGSSAVAGTRRLPVTVPEITGASTSTAPKRTPVRITPAEPEVTVTADCTKKTEEPAASVATVTPIEPKKQPENIDPEILSLRRQFEETKRDILALVDTLGIE